MIESNTTAKESTMANRTEAEMRVTHHRRATRFFWVWLVLATSLSLVGNVVHAWVGHSAAPDTGTRVLAAAVAAVPPTILLLSIHGIAVLVRAGASGAVYRTSVAATGALGCGAFALSFVALADLARMAGVPAALAPVLPLIVDLAIAVATLALVAVGDRPAPRARAARTAKAAASAHVERDGAPPMQRTDALDDGAVQHGDAARATTHDAPMRQTAAAVIDAAQRSDGAPVPAPEHLERAARIAASGAVAKGQDDIAAVLAGRAEGLSGRRIADVTGLNPRTVSKILAANAELDEDTADQPERVLAAV